MKGIPEDEIRNFVIQMHDLELDSLPKEEELKDKYVLSEIFYKRMDKLVKDVNKKMAKKTHLKYVVAGVAIVLMIYIIYNPKYVVYAYDTVVEWFQDHVSFHFKNTSEEELSEYKLNYVPEGYELLRSEYYDIGGGIEYSNGLTLIYNLSDSAINTDNEYGEYSIVNAHDGTKIYYYAAADEKEASILVWTSDDEDVAFILTGNLTENELFKIQKGVVPKK